MEKTQKAWVFLSDFGWSDLGTWESVYERAPKDAQDNVLSSAGMHLVDDVTGELDERSRSAFYALLARADQSFFTFTAPPREGLIREAREYVAMSERFLPEEESKGRFETGQRVRHTVLGEGTVVEIDEEKGAHIVKFDSVATPRAISFRAKLEASDEN